MTGIHQSQVSRILRGDFLRLSKNVQLLCKTLCIDPHYPATTKKNPRLSKLVCEVWDGSKKHEEVLVRLLDAVADISK